VPSTASSSPMLPSVSPVIQEQSAVSPPTPTSRRLVRRPPRGQTLHSHADAMPVAQVLRPHPEVSPSGGLLRSQAAYRPLDRAPDYEFTLKGDGRRRQASRSGRKFGLVASEPRLSSVAKHGGRPVLIPSRPPEPVPAAESSESSDSRAEREDSFYVHMQSGATRRQSLVTSSKRRVRSVVGTFFDRVKFQKSFMRSPSKHCGV
jgi:hypothetical protein